MRLSNSLGSAVCIGFLLALATVSHVVSTAVDDGTVSADEFVDESLTDDASRLAPSTEEEPADEQPADISEPTEADAELLGEVDSGGTDRPDPPAEALLGPADPADPDDPRHPLYVCTDQHPSCDELCLPFPPVDDVWEWVGSGIGDDGWGGWILVEEGVGQYWATPGTCCLGNQPTSCGENEGYYRPGDIDEDGWLDDEDLCPYHYDPTDPQPDLDHDGIGDGCDLCPGVPPGDYPSGLTSWNHFDLDGDGYGDECDDDDDGDGIDDDVDNCPAHDNPLEVDTDGDGIGDAQLDTDGDGFGNACDDDDDDDCILDSGIVWHGGDGWRPECQDDDGDGWSEVEGDCNDNADPDDAIPDGFDIYPGTGDTDPTDDIDDSCPIELDCRWNGWVTVEGLAMDNCDLIYNPGQEDGDGDGAGDACDRCPEDDLDSCTPVADSFCDLAVIDAVTPQCSVDFTVVENCYNLDLPPAPAIRRAFIPTDPSARAAVRKAGVGRRLPETWAYQPTQYHAPGKIVDLPRHRATPDGRLSTGKDGYGHPTIEIFFPENLDYGMESHSGRRVYSDGIRLPLAARYFPPLTPPAATTGRAPRMTLQDYIDDETIEAGTTGAPGWRGVWSDMDTPGAWPNRPSVNWDLCDGDAPEPFDCTASNKGTLYSGQCYQNTLLFTNKFNNGDQEQWELRSVATVVFVGSPDSPSEPVLHLPEGSSSALGAAETPNKIFVFPRAALQGSHLGDYDIWDVEEHFHSWKNTDSGDRYKDSGYLTHQSFLLMVETECMPANLEPWETTPQWCEWADEHEVRRSFYMRNNASPPGTPWDGESVLNQPLQILEPATTEDGRFLAMHIAGSIRYSYIDDPTAAACSARAFETFYPLSHAYFDDDLFDSGTAPIGPKYGFAAEQLRWPTGPGLGSLRGGQRTQDAPTKAPDQEKVLEWEVVPGSYPWVSAKGEVLAWPMANAEFGWKPEWVYSGRQEFDDTCDTQSDQVTNTDLGVNTVGAVVAGSWTRGKIVHMDNMINYSNFQGSYAHASELFRLPLYHDTEVFVRPRGISLLNSIENTMNHVEAVTPISPFDVVWLMSSNAHQTGELVFDDYLHPRAYVVAHMNETLRNFGAYGVKMADGFSEFDPSQRDPNAEFDDKWQFAESPSLQNASTFTDGVSGAPPIRLLGGAFVPPVAEGGVQGKGVFLDGSNDHIEVGGLHNTIENDFMVSVWLESHAEDNQARVLFSLDDGSYLTVRDGEVTWNQGSDMFVWSPGPPLANGGTRFRWYTHYALVVYDPGTGPLMRLYVDGNPMGVEHALTTRPLLGRAPNDNALYVGMNHLNPTAPPVRGWVDELRIYGLEDNTANSLHEVEENFFDEWVCNRALGSITHTVQSDPSCDQLNFRKADPHTAPDGWSYTGESSLPIGDGQDFSIHAYTQVQTCANQAHRSPPDDLDCVRDDLLGNPPMQLGVPRPDTTNEAFCLTCHADNHPTDGLWVRTPPGHAVGPLESLSGVAVEDDPRRQPLMWPSTSGYLPAVNGMSWGQTGTPVLNSFPADLDSYVMQPTNGKVKPRAP